MIYKIEFAPHLEKQLASIPEQVRAKIFDRIEKLKSNPRPENVEPLQGTNLSLFRFHQGDYRIVYSIQDKKLLLILVVRIVHQKEV